MFMNIVIRKISTLTETFYCCSKAAVNEESTEELISSSKSTNESPTRPPRKPRRNDPRFEIKKKYPSISNRSTTNESSIDDRGIKVVTAQIEGQPNLSITVVLPLRDADPTSDESELRGSRRRPRDKHDNTEKRLARSSMDETETFYLNLPSLDHRSMIPINSTIDASTSTKIYRPTQDSDNGQFVLRKVLYFFSKKENESNDSENDDPRVIIEARKVRRRGNCRENNENVFADKSSITINQSTTDSSDNSKSEEECLTKRERRKTLSKFFQCHK